jgi:cobalamin biosynthesis protein CobD/CbiB
MNLKSRWYTFKQQLFLGAWAALLHSTLLSVFVALLCIPSVFSFTWLTIVVSKSLQHASLSERAQAISQECKDGLISVTSGARLI